MCIRDSVYRNVCIVGVALNDGFAKISPCGSFYVCYENTIELWDRGSGRPYKSKTSKTAVNGIKVTVYFQNPEFRTRGYDVMLPVGGIARFYGSSEIYAEEGKMRDKIWNTMYPKECENGADKIG